MANGGHTEWLGSMVFSVRASCPIGSKQDTLMAEQLEADYTYLLRNS
jgi:hypothetical protein